MITAGMGGFFEQIIEEYVKPIARHIVRVGGSAKRTIVDELGRIIVWAKLVFINDHEPEQLIVGSTSNYVTKQHGASVEFVHSKVVAKSDYVVSAKRIITSDGNH